MVKYISRRILSGAKPGRDQGTYEHDLDNMGGIPYLEIIARATNGSGGNVSNGILNAITKIEVISHEGHCLFETSGIQAYRLATLRDREAPEISEGEGANAVQLVRIPLLFGRNKEDSAYGLDTRKGQGTRLLITYDLTAVRACGNDGYVSGSLDISLVASMTYPLSSFAYQGLFGARVMNAAWVTRAHFGVTELNTSGACVGMYMYAYKSGVADGSLISIIKLMAPTAREIIVDKDFTDYQEARKPLTGTKITSWAQIWLDPNRLGDKTPQPLPGDNALIELTELETDGTAVIIGEFLEK